MDTSAVARAESEVLFERDADLQRISALADRARAGFGAVHLLVGKRGVGKSSLVDAAVASLPGVAVLRGRGCGEEAEMPFGLIERVIPALEPPAGQVDPEMVRFSFHVRARDRILELVGSQPTFIVIDDFQWADPDSVSLLCFLARRLKRAPVVLLLAARPWPAHPLEAMMELVGQEEVTISAVENLTRSGTEALLRATRGRSVGSEEVALVYQQTGGNPSLVLEAVQADRQPAEDAPGSSFQAKPATGKWSPPAASRGWSDGAQTVAQALAVLSPDYDPSRPVAFSFVEATAGLPLATFVSGLDELVADGAIVVDAGGAHLASEWLAGAVSKTVLPGQHWEFNSRAFEFALRQGWKREAAVRAVSAPLLGEARAVDLLIDLGRQAYEIGAFKTAAEHLRNALTLAGRRGPADLSVQYAKALFQSGQSQAAIDCVRALLAGNPDRSTRLVALERLAYFQLYSGDLAGADLTYETLLANDLPIELRSSAIAEQIYLKYEQYGPARARNLLNTYENEFALPPGQRLAIDAFYCLEMGMPFDWAALDLGYTATAIGSSDGIVPNVFLLATAYFFCGRITEAETLIEHVLGEVVGMHLNAVSVAVLRLLRVDIRLRRGLAAEMVAEIAVLEELKLANQMYHLRLNVKKITALLDLGRIDQVEQELARLDSTQIPAIWQGQFDADICRIKFALASQRLGDACERLWRLGHEIEKIGHIYYISLWVETAIDVCFRSGDIDGLQKAIDSLERLGTEQSNPSNGFLHCLARAYLADCQGDPDVCARYEEALTFDITRPFLKCQLAIRYGRWLRKRSRLEASRTQLVAALAIARKHGYGLLCQEAEDELSVARGRGPARPDDSHLTPMELRVCRLLRAGDTNPRIAQQLGISRNTVESHLSRIYMKLGVATRHELRSLPDDRLDRASPLP
jgi:DNA-binding CsgD family transcriptional regulator